MFDSLRNFVIGAIDSLLEYAIAFPGGVLALVVTYLTAIAVTRIMERRGRTRGAGAVHGWMFIQIWVVVICIPAWVLVVPRLFSGPGPWATGLEMAFTFVAGACVGAVVSISFSLLLPNRKRTGVRHRTVTLAGRAVQTLSYGVYCAALPATLAFAWWAWGVDANFIDLIVILFVAGALFISMVLFAGSLAEGARRLSPSGASAGEVVLYLRPFEEEHRLFARGINFEGFVNEEMRRIAPLVALGNPADRMSPKGAARSYSSDSHWQALVEDFAVRAICIVGLTTSSANTSWELTRIRQMGLQSKLFLLSPPGDSEAWGHGAVLSKQSLASRIGSGLWAARRAYGEGNAEKIVQSLSFGQPPSSMSYMALPNWADFVRVLTACGYYVDGPEPGPGAVITFDSQGRIVLASQGAETPSEFVDAIIDRLD